nr:IS3 family transposase [Amycolatopsis taiwanensis]
MNEKYEFIAEEYARNNANGVVDAPTLTHMLTSLVVSKSGYYEWLNRPASAIEQRCELLKIKIMTLFDLFGGTYGYRRIHAELVRAGERVDDETVRKLMRELGLVTVQPKPYRVTTTRSAHEPDVPDLVRRNFTGAARHQAGRRHHLHQHLAGLALLGDNNRLFQQRSDRVRHVRPHAHGISYRRPGDDRTQSRPRTGLHHALRPRYPGWIQRSLQHLHDRNVATTG